VVAYFATDDNNNQQLYIEMKKRNGQTNMNIADQT